MKLRPLRETFSLAIFFALENEKESKNDKKTFLRDYPRTLDLSVKT